MCGTGSGQFICHTENLVILNMAGCRPLLGHFVLIYPLYMICDFAHINNDSQKIEMVV